jgi:hypothetical protein
MNAVSSPAVLHQLTSAAAVNSGLLSPWGYISVRFYGSERIFSWIVPQGTEGCTSRV